jgi:hypothetical protein
MLLGLIADIHEAVEPLREALARFRELNVDQVVHLGDVCEMHKRLDETCRVLAEARVEGVWGNHDFGLCRATDDEVRRKFTPGALDYLGTMQPRLVRDDCLLTHVEPWLDPNDVFQLWYFEGMPDTPEKLAPCFGAAPQRVLFSGHAHRWFLATPDTPCEWRGDCPIRLAPPQRYMLVMHALVEGHCATYDTTTHLFTPIRVTAEG